MRLSLLYGSSKMMHARRFIVRGGSMEPAFQDGDCLLVDRRVYRRRAPRRGEAVVLRLPVDGQAYLKRVVGLPGEWVHLTAEGVLVDGEPIDEPYLSDQNVPWQFVGQEWHLGQDECVVLGDTRSDSFDSRRFGAVGIEQLEGAVFFRYWPLSKWGIVRS